MRKWIIGGLIICLATLILVKYWVVIDLFILPSKGQQFETWQTQNELFQLRVDAFHEKHSIEAGTYFTFSSAPVGSDDWKQIMTFRYDGPIEIPKNQVHFVSADVGFVFMGWMFASTNDAGKNWQTWNACNKATLDICNYGGIQKVDLSPTGSGTMTINPWTEPPLPLLQTEDFGRTWNE